MAYSLEKRTGQPPQAVWKQYATCGDRALLERVRAGQEHPEHWRTRPNACSESYEGHLLVG